MLTASNAQAPCQPPGTKTNLAIEFALFTAAAEQGSSHRPQHVLGSLGLVSFLLGSAGLAYLIVTWFVRLYHPDAYPPLHQRPLLIYSLAGLLLGAQLLSIGFLAELLTRFLTRDEDAYSVAERLEPPTEPEAPP